MSLHLEKQKNLTNRLHDFAWQDGTLRVRQIKITKPWEEGYAHYTLILNGSVSLRDWKKISGTINMTIKLKTCIVFSNIIGESLTWPIIKEEHGKIMQFQKKGQ